MKKQTLKLTRQTIATLSANELVSVQGGADADGGYKNSGGLPSGSRYCPQSYTQTQGCCCG